MYGFSYPGHTQLQIAVRNPEGLRCMVPAMTSPDLYEGWAYNNGAFALAFNASWATFLADDVARRRDPDLEPRPRRPVRKGQRLLLVAAADGDPKSHARLPQAASSQTGWRTRPRTTTGLAGMSREAA